jgi:hypothetical protein
MNYKYQIKTQIIDFKKGISLGTLSVNVSEEYYDKIRSLTGYNDKEYGLQIEDTEDQPVYIAIRAIEKDMVDYNDDNWDDSDHLKSVESHPAYES